ncbi:tetratricopeptide repeat protein [Chitinophaga agrisoli]|uniref:Tetratricopeptide repeat protein n=1 Tax=Chitinophaga agrisoli TaxID=2607653 RepID=A0A5B2W1A4_9BACT|nr:alpha/beta hydrolase-fold protein [Chitinophaga agrisoli]KAA2244844.1 tetratricopeptide repeat protein [Chitinophaga agrisoli]
MHLTIRALILAGLFSLSLTCGQAQQNNAVVIGTMDSIHSRILKEQRTVWVHVPASAQGNGPAKKKYPVIYLLDGDKNFTGVVGMVDLLSSVNGNNLWPEMIVVGIPNTDRTRDLTPTRVTSGLWIDSSTARRSGGGEAFTAFIEKELIPHIDSLYPTIPYRMLIGHSFGGLIVINTLLYHKALFNSYVAIDPSMWWDRQRLLHETGQALHSHAFSGKTLYLGMAHTQPPGLDTAMLQRDTTEGTLHPRSILQLSRYIMDTSQNGLQADFKYYDAETHGSVALMTTYDALHFIFKDYPLQFQDSYFTDPAFKLAQFLTAHYQKITTKYGFTAEDGSALLPPEDMVNNLGYFVMGKKEFEKAEEMFELNIKNYPSGFQAYSYLGDVYAAKGDREKAIASYKKSLSLKETEKTKKKLAKLER